MQLEECRSRVKSFDEPKRYDQVVEYWRDSERNGILVFTVLGSIKNFHLHCLGLATGVHGKYLFFVLLLISCDHTLGSFRLTHVL